MAMKYFTYDLVAAANDWIEQTEQARLEADQRFSQAELQYHRSLGELKTRISRQAWSFFESGSGRWGLHDGRLISLCVGDALEYGPDGASPFCVNHQRTVARVVFVNHERDLLYTFELRQISSMRTDLKRSEPPNRCLGDLFTYEIISVDKDLMQLGFLFAAGGSIVAQFKKLIFRRQRLTVLSPD